MTRWNILKDLMMARDSRRAVGKAWPLFFYIVFNANKSNKLITSYHDLETELKESPNTIKNWRDFLVKNKVIEVNRGRSAMTVKLCPPYDVLVTCRQDDRVQVKMKADPAARKILDKLSAYGNMSLLPVVAELTQKLDKLEKKIDGF